MLQSTSAQKYCQNCGVIIDPSGKYYAYQKYCTEKCNKAAKQKLRNKRRIDSLEPITKTCPGCSNEFTFQPGVSGKPPKYCSNECRKDTFANLQKSHNAQTKNIVCSNCEKVFTVRIGINKQKHCSSECRIEARNKYLAAETCSNDGCSMAVAFVTDRLCKRHYRERYAERCTVSDCNGSQLAKGLCPKHYAQEKTTAGLRKKYDYICQECGAPGIGLNKDQKAHKQCAQVIATRAGSTAAKERYLAKCRSQSQELILVQKQQPVHQVTIIPGAVMFYTTCKVCGKQFLSRYTHRTCSDECKKIHHRQSCRDSEHRRRARMRKAYVANVRRKEIFERDNYTCQLCGQPMNMKATAPQHKQSDCCTEQCFKSPTIDHIIPIAKGGTHEPNNVQSAHFICNTLKSDSIETMFDVSTGGHR